MLTRFFLIFLIFISFGCSPRAPHNPSLGFQDSRRVVIVGEKVKRDIAYYYQRKYDAPVWFTPSGGKVFDSGNRMLETIGPTTGMKILISELESINYSVGQWEIIVPKIAEHYFLATLEHMETNSLVHARGMFVLIDSSGNKDMETQVNRVTDGNFFVTYELHKDLNSQQ